MPTRDDVSRLAARFERDAPATLPKRLARWSSRLGIDRRRLLRLLGMTRAEAFQHQRTPLDEVVSDQHDQAERLDDMLGQLLASFFDYDLAAMKSAIHNPAGP